MFKKGVVGLLLYVAMSVGISAPVFATSPSPTVTTGVASGFIGDTATFPGAYASGRIFAPGGFDYGQQFGFDPMVTNTFANTDFIYITSNQNGGNTYYPNTTAMIAAGSMVYSASWDGVFGYVSAYDAANLSPLCPNQTQVWCNPNYVTVSTTPGVIPRAIAKLGNNLYTANSDGSLSTFSINGSTIAFVSTTSVGQTSGFTSVVALGSYLWIGDSDGTVWQVNPANAALIRQIHVEAVGSPSVNAVTSDGNMIYTGNSDGTVSSINASDTSAPTLTANFAAELNATSVIKGVLVQGGYIWTTDYTDSNVSQIDPTTHDIVSVSPVDTHPMGIFSDGTNVWVVAEGSFSKISFTAQADPNLVSQTPGSSTPVTVTAPATTSSTPAAHTLAATGSDLSGLSAAMGLLLIGGAAISGSARRHRSTAL